MTFLIRGLLFIVTDVGLINHLKGQFQILCVFGWGGGWGGVGERAEWREGSDKNSFKEQMQNSLLLKLKYMLLKILMVS